MPEEAPVLAWTCGRCEVTASWMPEVERPAMPADWAEVEGVLYCLGCRRELAGEAGVLAVPDEASAEKRQQLRAHARIEFEVTRDPERPDNRIAKACRTSIPSVQKARERLGLPPAARP
jgi:hypothetical protein